MPMLNPWDSRETLRDDLEAAKLSVTEAASRPGCHPAGAVAAVEREGRHLAGDGTGAGPDRPGQYKLPDGLQTAYVLARELRRQAA